MFEDNVAESYQNPNVEKKFPQPPFLQRSVSAPAIAEHVSEAVIPAFQYEDNEEVRLNISAYQLPSRHNPRLPQSKKAIAEDTEQNPFVQLPLSLLAEDSSLPRGLMSTLILDPHPRTPMDLIQADFPATPSSIYSKHVVASSDSRLAETMSRVELSNMADNGDYSQQASTASTKSIPALISKSAAPEAKNSSLDLTPAMVGASTSAVPLLSQLHSSLPTSSTAPGHRLTTSPNSSLFQASSLSALTSSTNEGTLLGNHKPAETSQSANAISNRHAPSHYSGILGAPTAALTATANSPRSGTISSSVNGSEGPSATTMSSAPSLIAQNTKMSAAPGLTTGLNVNPPLPIQQQSNVVNQQGMSQSQFYIPQIYVSSNGQPFYYRSNIALSQYPQEFVFAPQMVDQNGLQIPSTLVGDSSQISLQQPIGAYIATPFPGASLQTTFWPTAVPDATAIPATPLFTSVRTGTAEDAARMMFQQQVGGGAFPYAMTAIPQVALHNNFGRPVAPTNFSQNQLLVAKDGVLTSAVELIPPLASSEDKREAVRFSGEQVILASNITTESRDGKTVAHASSYNAGSSSGHRGNYDYANHHSGSHHQSVQSPFTRDGRGHRNAVGAAGNGQAMNNSARDSLVEEFRSTFGKSRQWSLKDLANHVVAFCQDQHGSRFIQQKLEICSEQEKQMIFEEIYPFAQVLMTDVFGNYVLQKLFEYGSTEQCESLANLLKGQAVQLSMQMYGCRVVQKALEYVAKERLIELVAEFDNAQMLVRCVHDSNGNHVIQKCIEIVSKTAKGMETKEQCQAFSSKIQFIIDAFKGRVKELSSHPYGCRVVQRILEYCDDSQKGVILEELRSCCGELVQDCYGNYVIQFVMQHGWDVDRAVLIRDVQDHLLAYSQHKFASNVVEKCLQYASKRDRDEMIWTIINVTFDLNNPVDSKGHCVLESMVRDPYANYVVQKVIDVSDDKQRAAIMRYVKDNISQLRKYTYGKHIIVRLEKITNEKF